MCRLFFALPLCFALFPLAVADEPATSGIDTLELCQCLTQEERNALKRHPIICDALEVINRMPQHANRTRQYEPQREGIEPTRAMPLAFVVNALQKTGDKEAAKAALRLAHKAFIDTPFFVSQPYEFFGRLNQFYSYENGDASLLSADDFYSQEFLDDLLARCGDDFSDNIYHDGQNDGNARFRESLGYAVRRMTRQEGNQKIDTLLEKGINFVTRLPDNKTCEGMRKELFFTLFREFPIERASALVEKLSDPDTKKEFTSYLAELKEWQIRAVISPSGALLSDESKQSLTPPTREELQTLADTTEDIVEKCNAFAALAMDDLEQGNIENAVKLARELETMYPKAERRYYFGRTETFFSKLAVMLFKAGQYEQGIDYLIEGAGYFSVVPGVPWSNGEYEERGTPFIVPPLRELYTAIQEEPARTTIRKKLQTAQESVKDFETYAESQQFRAVVEAQIALGFEEDALAVLKTAKVMQKNNNTWQEPLWNGMTAMRFQLRCGLLESALETYSKIMFTDTVPLSREEHYSPSFGTDRTLFLQGLVEMCLARNQYDHAEKIIELIREEHIKPIMQISLARAYQRSGDFEKALAIIAAITSPSGEPSPDENSLGLARRRVGKTTVASPAASRALGYHLLLSDLLENTDWRTQNAERISMLREKCCAEIKQIEGPESRYDQYLVLMTLLYRNDQRESAMKMIDEVDSPYYAAWILLNLAATHESEKLRFDFAVPSRGFGQRRMYSGYHTEEELFCGEYNAPDQYLDLALVTQSVDKNKSLVDEQKKKWEAWAAKRNEESTPIEPDRAAMKVLLDKAAVLIEKEPSLFRRAYALGMIGGQMEYVDSAPEKAQSHFNEALALLQSMKIEADSGGIASTLSYWFWKLGDKKRALESVNIALFGNDPDGQAGDIPVDPSRVHTSYLIELAKCGDAERAYKLFFQAYDAVESEWKPGALWALPIIALYHDKQHPEKPLLPTAQEQYRQFYGELIRNVDWEKEDFNGDSPLRLLLYRWEVWERHMRDTQKQIAEQEESSGMVVQPRFRQTVRYADTFDGFGNLLDRIPIFYVF
jgi:tetratricopeptide (TPR) repeat protein